MTSLFQFEDRVHRQSLPRAKSLPLLFHPRLCQVLEHIGFPAKPRTERRHDCGATLTIERWRARPRGFHLPPPGLDEDKPEYDSPRRDLSPIAKHAGGPPALVSLVSPRVSSPLPATPPVAPTLVPQASIPSTSQQTSSSLPTVQSDIAGPSTFHTSTTLHYPHFQGLPDSHGDGPHILNHYGFYRSFSGHASREDDPH